MKKSILVFLLLSTTFSFGQKLDFGLSVGTGKSYLFESIDKTVNVNYRIPISLMTEIKFTPKEHSSSFHTAFLWWAVIEEAEDYEDKSALFEKLS